MVGVRFNALISLSLAFRNMECARTGLGPWSYFSLAALPRRLNFSQNSNNENDGDDDVAAEG